MSKKSGPLPRVQSGPSKTMPKTQSRVQRVQSGSAKAPSKTRLPRTQIGQPSAESTRLQSRTVPRSGGIPRVSSGYGRPSAIPSTGSLGGTKCGTVACETKMPLDKSFELPPLSIPLPKKDVYEQLERLKAKTRRRHAPEGEDIKSLKEILKNMVNKEVTVHEFVGLLSPYTADNGTTLRNILANELSHFRTLARRVYDTMTQDVSDVLINEHIQLTEASKERHAQYTDKMIRAIDEIHEHVPRFNFEKYYSYPDEYLEKLFPQHFDLMLEEEAEALQMRQEAYHRLMWLRSEGDRLSEENKRLNGRLKELKHRQKLQMKKAGEIEKLNEDKRKELEKTQEALEDELDDMNTSIEKTLVEKEKAMREEEDVLVPSQELSRRKYVQKKKTKKIPENWNIKAAAQIEGSQTVEALVSDVSKVSMASSVASPKPLLTKPSTGAVPKQRAKGKAVTSKRKFKLSKPKMQQDTDPFQYSPVKSPPGARSPFHYSPPKTPPRDFMEEAGAVPNMETTRIRTTTSNVNRPPTRRRGAGSHDSWGGYY